MCVCITLCNMYTCSRVYIYTNDFPKDFKIILYILYIGLLICLTH